MFAAAIPAQAQATQETDLFTRVYYRASAASYPIGCLKDGTVLTVLGSTGDFYRIDCFDMEGYLPKSQAVLRHGEYYVNCKTESAHTLLLESRTLPDTMTLRGQIYEGAMGMLGVPYRLGGTSRRGIDCSALTQYAYGQAGLSLGRTCEAQMAQSVIIPKDSLQCGDLVFFKNTTRGGGMVSHVGIYIGDGKLLHASSSKGVRIVELESEYYVNHYLCARRVLVSQPPVAQVEAAGSDPWRSLESRWLRSRG